MSIRRIFICLFVLIIVASTNTAAFTGYFGNQESETTTDKQDRDEEKNNQDKTAKSEKLSVMDQLRQKLMGLTSLTIQILSSGSTETSGDWITVRENAEVSIGLNKSLLADVVKFNPSTNEVMADGNVVLIENKMRISGDNLTLNLDNNKGRMTNPYIESSEGFFISGKELEKIGPDEYLLKGARLTTCNQPSPNWQMAASSIKFKAGEWATLKNLRLNMAKIPVFYFPFVTLPMDRERGTGFLLPQWGTSDFHGTWINTQFFWAINRSNDATFGLDYYSKRGYRYSGEYRNDYGDSNYTRGYMFFIDDKTTPRSRFDARFVNRQKFPWGFNTYADLQFLSDNTYRRDFINRDIYYSPLYRKTLSLSNSFEGFNFQVAYNDINRFFSANRISLIRYLPTIDFRSRDRQLFNLPLFYSFSTNYSRPHMIQITKRTVLEDKVDEEVYNRYDLQGEVKLPLKGPWLSVSPKFAVHDTEYSKSYRAKKDVIVDKPISRRYYDFGVDLIGPVFSKVFGKPGESLSLFKHVITPKISYLYRSELDKKTQERIIILDQVDTFFRVHELRWGVSNVIRHKSITPGTGIERVVEVLNVDVSQYVSMENDLLTSFDKRYVFDPSLAEVTSRFSPVQVAVTARVMNNLRAFANLEYSLQENKFINYTLSGNLNFRNLNYNIGWYRTVGVVQFTGSGFNRSQTNRLVTSGNLTLLDGLINLRGAWDYDFTRERILNYLAGVDIRGQCLGASFEVRKLNLLNQNDLQTRFNIVIGGLGAILTGQER